MVPNKAFLPAASVGHSHPPARLTNLKEDAVGGLRCLRRSDAEEEKLRFQLWKGLSVRGAGNHGSC